MNQSRQNWRPAPSRHTGRRSAVGSPLLSILFFPAIILYHELLLQAFDESFDFFTMALVRIPLFSIAAGLFLFLILDLLPWRRAARIAGGVLIVLWTIILCIEHGCRNMFGLYYGISFMGTMAGDVMGDFGSLILSAILGMIPFILLSTLPAIAYFFLRHTIIRDDGQEGIARIIVAAGMVVCQLLGWALSAFGPVSNYYTYEYSATASIPHFGLMTCVRLELEYAILGAPTPPLSDFIDEPPATAVIGPYESTAPTAPSDPTAAPTQDPRTTGPNVLDIDFEALAAAEENETIQNMHQYFASLTPSEKNQYTGMFQGKNLILITAEGFSTYAIDKELTPTLYKLSQEGFVFNNFYQPDWTQSTCGGEFSVTTGVIPNWISPGPQMAAPASADNAMPTVLPKLFAPLGYNVPAFHNHTYTYYKRNTYLENFGYDFKAKDNGITLENPELWPESDLEMMQATCRAYIDDYVNNGTPFHAYYMTVSGHGKYTWADNAMSTKHREEVQAKYPDMSEVCQAYLACNMELDQALEHLISQLEEAGIADDTLIVMAADHYPYLMVMEDGTDYYNELRGFEDSEDDTSRYRNTLFMWSGAIKTPIQVDTPCSSIDIVPTVCNLFGLEYDSRLYSGRDIFAENYEADQYSNCMPLVVFANKGKGNSWITAAGTYESSTGTFIPNEGVTVDEEYVSRVKRLVSAKVNYSKLIVQEDYYKYVFPGSVPQGAQD